MVRSNLNEMMVSVLVDYYALYLKLQNYHWNVEGPNFVALHAMFEDQYTDVAGAIDTTAELIRGLGHKVPVVREIYTASAIQPAQENGNAEAMIRDTIHSYEQMQESLLGALKKAQEEEDEVIADFVVGRLTAHRKTLWMLRSHLG